MGKINNKYPEGHFVGKWIGIGIAIFSGIGIAISIALKSPGLMGIGPTLGVAFGVGIGTTIEEKYKKEGLIRPLTQKERTNKKIAVLTGIVLLLIGCVFFVSIYLNSK